MLHVIGLDLGTSGLKTVLVDERGRVLRSDRQTYGLQTPAAGWSEQDPRDWWRALGHSIRTVLDGMPAPDAVGLVGQMHTAVVLDAEDAPLCPAILWNDQRTERECREIGQRLGGSLAAWTGNRVRTAFTATKLLWLRRHRPELYRRIRSVLLPKDFLRLRLTGVRATDVTDASGTGVFDVHRRCWSDDALGALEIPRSWMPDAVESATPIGEVDGQGGRSSGLRSGTPVVAGAGDQAAAALGSGTGHDRAISITLGTSATGQVSTAAPVSDPSGVLQTFCHALPDTWQLLAAVLSGGGSLEWFSNIARVPEDIDSAAFERLCEAAATVPPGAEGLIFLPHLTGEAAPFLDPAARGAWLGLTRRHDHRHLARAVIEGVSFAIRSLVEAVEALTGHAEEIRMSGGGGHGHIWLQTFANVLGRRIMAVGASDASARGAALLAMAAASGRDPRDLAVEWAMPGRPIDPEPEPVARYEAQYAIFRETYPTTRHLMHRLADLDRDHEASIELTPPGR